MKPTFIALLALCLCLGGCGKKAGDEKAAAEKFAASKPGTVIWQFETGGPVVTSSPAIGPDGTVYVGEHFDLITLRDNSNCIAPDRC